MIAGSTFLQLALLPTLALGSAITARAKGEENPFEYDSLDLREVGARNTLDWRIWLERDGKPISFWQDIPIYPNKEEQNIVNFVVEIPRWSDAKVDMNINEPLNPIYHVSKDNQPWFVESTWPHRSYPFHYGFIPQTWEDPQMDRDYSGYKGDNGPIDLFDISDTPAYTGQVKKVKILGGLVLKDVKTASWKVIGVDMNDPLAHVVDDMDDLAKLRPGLAGAFLEWFQEYLVAGNGYVLEVFDKEYHKAKKTVKTVGKSHRAWGLLLRGYISWSRMNFNQTHNKDLDDSYIDTKETVEKFNIPKENSKALCPGERPERYDNWFYLDENHDLIQV